MTSWRTLRIYITQLSLIAFIVLGYQGAEAQLFALASQDLLDRQGDGEVNWTNGTISARGIGVPPPHVPSAAANAMAHRAAKAVALRNLMELIQGIHVDSETVIKNFLLKNDEIRTRVSGIINNAQEMKRKILPDGSIEVFLSAPLWGKESMTSAFLDEKHLAPTNRKREELRDGYTGVVFDTRGLNLRPVVFPVVTDETGSIVYGPEVVSREAAEASGLAEYYVTHENDQRASLETHVVVVAEKQATHSLPRVGRRPLRIKGLKAAGSLHANIIVSTKDAQKIREDPNVLQALRNANVVIIADPLVAGIEGKRVVPHQRFANLKKDDMPSLRSLLNNSKTFQINNDCLTPPHVVKTRSYSKRLPTCVKPTLCYGGDSERHRHTGRSFCKDWWFARKDSGHVFNSPIRNF